MRRLALLIGVQEYLPGSGVASLRYAHADARELGAALQESCRFDDVRVLTTSDPDGPQLTDTAILNTLRDMSAQLNEDDLFLFFFAGHGIERNIEGASRSFLLAPNASLQFNTGLLDLALLRDSMARMVCAQRIFLLDCCRNDPHAGRGDAGNLMTPGLTRDILAAAERAGNFAPNRVTLVMNACRPGERSYERDDVKHGAFSYWLIRGLRGEAWSGGGLQGAPLCQYVQNQLANWSDRTGHLQHADFQQMESAAPVWLVQGQLDVEVPVSPPTPPPAQSRPNGDVHLQLPGGVAFPVMPIPAGDFRMGAPEEDTDAFTNERPFHPARITKRFWISTHPITISQWAAVMGVPEGADRSSDDPMTRISWDDAQELSLRLTQMVAQGDAAVHGLPPLVSVRLPTEAEWEYAVRHLGAESSAQWIGLCWQWCEDWFAPYPFGLAIDPKGPREGTERVLRGGAPGCKFRFLRATVRGHLAPERQRPDVGFRVVLMDHGM